MPEQWPLAEWFPAGFNRERPQPLKLNLHRDWIAAGYDRAAVARGMKMGCKPKLSP